MSRPGHFLVFFITDEFPPHFLFEIYGQSNVRLVEHVVLHSFADRNRLGTTGDIALVGTPVCNTALATLATELKVAASPGITSAAAAADSMRELIRRADTSHLHPSSLHNIPPPRSLSKF